MAFDITSPFQVVETAEGWRYYLQSSVYYEPEPPYDIVDPPDLEGPAAVGANLVTSVNGQIGDVVITTSTPQPSLSGNYLVSGGGVAFDTGLDVIVSAADYVIQGTAYSAPQTELTAATADPTDPRIDVVAVNTSGVAVLITGTPAATPVKPDVDAETQLELTFFLVLAGATSIGTNVVDLYHENTEWTSSRSGTTFTLNSADSPRAGSTCIRGVSVTSTNYFQLTGPGNIDLADNDNLIFYIRNDATWPETRTLSITARQSNTQRGTAVSFGPGSYGFDATNTTTYQQIVIPLSDFGANGLTVNRFRWTCIGSGTTLNMHVDDITLQGGLTGIVDSSRMRWRGDYVATNLYPTNDVVLDGGSLYVALQPAIAQTPATATDYWATLTGSVDVQTFTADGTWTKPSGCTLVKVICIGNGGGGGGGCGGSAGVIRIGGTGGGGGAISERIFLASDLGATEAVTVIAGATGGPGGSSALGGPGQVVATPTTFGSHLSAYGGGSGVGNTTNNLTGGGGGGTAGSGGSGALTSSLGGAPQTATNAAGLGGQGSGNAVGQPGKTSESGGAAGGGTQPTLAGKGGTAQYGAGGGGAGGSISAANAGIAGGDGGAGNSYSVLGGGGGAGGTGSAGDAGTAGQAGTSVRLGNGGGGGASNTAGTGGDGGAGGAPGGGGGGGGGGTTVGGAGGAGASGEVRVYSW